MRQKRNPSYPALLIFIILATVLLAGCRIVPSGNFTLESGETVRGNLLITSGNAVLEEDSRVTGSVWITSGNLMADGEIEGDIVLTSGNASLGPQAYVHGDIVTTSGSVQRATGARVDGEETSTLSLDIGRGLAALACLLPLGLIVGLILLILLVRAMVVPARPVPVQASQAVTTGQPVTPVLPTSPVPQAPSVPQAQPVRSVSRNAGSLVVGLLLVVLGVLFLLGQLVDIDLWNFSWPFFIILAGLLFFLGMILGGRGAAPLAIPGSIITTAGLILLYQNTFDHFESWAYAWALLFPAAVGLGMVIQGLWGRQPRVRRDGSRLLGIGLMIFLIAGTFFELIINISGFGGGNLAGFVFPLLLIGIGIFLLLNRGLGLFRR